MSNELTSREVCQRLRDAALGVASLRCIGEADSSGHVSIDIEDWRLLLDFEGQRLHHCEHCRCADGREGSLDVWQRYGTDPVSLLSTWELAEVERLLVQNQP